MNVRIESGKGLALVVFIVLMTAGDALAQRWGRGWGGEGWHPAFDTCRTAREVPSHSVETPNWTNAPGFEKDVFAFARIRRDRAPYGSRSAGYGSLSAASWWTDFPDSDLNLSFRLQQMTSMKVDPNGRVLNLTDKELPDYPFIYMVEPGSLRLRNEEVPILRQYLLNGGVLMADDFWGDAQWEVFRREISRVLPERDFVDVPLDHPIFHCVFNLAGPLNNLQTPNIGRGIRSQYDGITWESHDGEACTEVHVRAILDDLGRILVVATHNTDNGDGWEREGEDDYFFHQFSEKRAYPLAVNILFYLMTH